MDCDDANVLHFYVQCAHVFASLRASIHFVVKHFQSHMGHKYRNQNKTHFVFQSQPSDEGLTK